MNRRKTIYRGFNNNRHKIDLRKYVITIACLCLIGYYSYTKIKDSKILEYVSAKIPFLNNSSDITYKDISDELNSIKKGKKSKSQTNSDDKQETNPEKAANNTKEPEEVKLATIEGWDMYTIQVAAIDNNDDLKKIQTSLVNNDIPFSVMEKDGVKKIQTYSSFDENDVRKQISSVRKVFPDAFLSHLDAPMLSLEYTSNYAYIESISKELNKLITNFKEESSFWSNAENNVDMEKYNTILTNRKAISQNISKEAEKIDYSEMRLFKDNLMEYVKNVNEKIDTASKAANEEKYSVSKSLLLSSMQEYSMFINSIK